MSTPTVEKITDRIARNTTGVSTKQDALVSGTNIKTINGRSVLGSGDLVVSGSDSTKLAILNNLSDLNDASTARVNIGLSTTANQTDSINKRFVTDSNLTTIGNTSGTNTGNQTSIVGITGTKAEFDTAVTGGDFVFVGDAVLNPEGWSVIVKSANQDITNSATLVNDTAFQFSVVAGGHYMIEMNLLISCNSATGDYKLLFKVSSGTMKGSGIFVGTSNTAVAQTTAFNVNVLDATTIISSGTNAADLDLLASAKIIFSFTASANATLSYQFAQSSAVVATTARTWKGSILKYKRID